MSPYEDTPSLSVGGPDVAWRETGEEIVVLDLEESVYFALNASAASLWRLLALGANRADLVRTLCAGGAADRDTAERDVDAFLARLAEAELLHTA